MCSVSTEHDLVFVMSFSITLVVFGGFPAYTRYANSLGGAIKVESWNGKGTEAGGITATKQGTVQDPTPVMCIAL